jgi:hypothetical protein
VPLSSINDLMRIIGCKEWKKVPENKLTKNKITRYRKLGTLPRIVKTGAGIIEK